MKIAIVHDWLDGPGCAQAVLQAVLRIAGTGSATGELNRSAGPNVSSVGVVGDGDLRRRPNRFPAARFRAAFARVSDEPMAEQRAAPRLAVR